MCVCARGSLGPGRSCVPPFEGTPSGSSVSFCRAPFLVGTSPYFWVQFAIPLALLSDRGGATGRGHAVGSHAPATWFGVWG